MPIVIPNTELIPKAKSYLLSWIFTPLHIFFFILILLFIHPLLLLAKFFGGEVGLYHINALHNACHLLNMRFCGTRFEISGEVPPFPARGGMIIVSNHQSMYDIPLLTWTLRNINPKFIAKIELTKWIPSISYSLRHGGHGIIRRQDPESAVASLRSYGAESRKADRTVVIFPEGTRARDGQVKPFKARGFSTLKEEMPEAPVVPIAIEGSSALLHNKLFPFPYGIRVRLHIFPLIAQQSKTPEDILKECEACITKKITDWRQNEQN
jgi:1-acyl-sn-glycerol-3-phosphate acyltransferase